MFTDGTLGSYEEYHTLNFLSDKMNFMQPKQREYISSFIHNFNQHMKNVTDIKNEHTFRFVLEAVRKEYLIRLLALEEKYDTYFVSHLRNFFVTKIKRTLEQYTLDNK